MKFEVTAEQLRESEARAEEFFKTDEFAKQVKNGWAINRAEEPVVYNQDQQYINETGVTKEIEQLYADDYGLLSYDEMKKKAPTLDIPEYDGDPKEWYRRKTTTDPLRDYKGRIVRIDKTTFEEHSTDKQKSRAFRKQLLLMAEEALRNPDEVWLQRKEGERPQKKQGNKKEKPPTFNNLRFLKFYKGEVISVVCSPTAEGYTLTSWFIVQEDLRNPNLPPRQQPKMKYRRGLLVKSSKEAF